MRTPPISGPPPPKKRDPSIQVMNLPPKKRHSGIWAGDPPISDSPPRPQKGTPASKGAPPPHVLPLFHHPWGGAVTQHWGPTPTLGGGALWLLGGGGVGGSLCVSPLPQAEGLPWGGGMFGGSPPPQGWFGGGLGWFGGNPPGPEEGFRASWFPQAWGVFFGGGIWGGLMAPGGCWGLGAAGGTHRLLGGIPKNILGDMGGGNWSTDPPPVL